MALETSLDGLKDLDYGKSKPEGIRYALKAVNKRFLKAAVSDARTARVHVLPKRTIHQAEVIEHVARNVNLSTRLTGALIGSLVDYIVAELKAGNKVSLDRKLLFGVSVQGRVSPQHPEDVKNLKVIPHVRFSQAFHRALNEEVCFEHDSRYQAPVVNVERLTVMNNVFSASGFFHNIQTLKIELLQGEKAYVCETVELHKDKASKRNIGTSLSIFSPVRPRPPEARTLRFTYRDLTGSTVSFTRIAEDLI